jgi:hypothetical protein
VRCGELCKSCVGKCQKVVSEKYPADIQCPACEGDGCEHCSGGYFSLTECPSIFIGRDLIDEIRIVTATEQHLPVAGGLLDQSAWWFELRERLRSEEARIRDEQDKRRR